MAQNYESPVNMESAEVAEALRALRDGDGVRVAMKGRVVLCDNLDDVKAASGGKIPRGAVRLDRARW